MLVPPSGSVNVLQTQALWLGPAFAGRHVTIWADTHSLHVALDGQHVKTVASRLTVEQLSELARRGATPAGLPPAAPALPRGRSRLPAGHSVELDRVVGRDGIVRVANQSFVVPVQLAGQRIALRLDGRLMHAIADGRVIKSWPMAIAPDKLTALTGAHAPSAAVPVPQPAGEIQSTTTRPGRRRRHDRPTTASDRAPARRQDHHHRRRRQPVPCARRRSRTRVTPPHNDPSSHQIQHPPAAVKSEPVRHVLRTNRQACPETSHIKPPPLADIA